MAAMAELYPRSCRENTDGGETESRSMKAFRLVDTLEGEAACEQSPTNGRGGERPAPKEKGQPTVGAAAPRRSRPVSPKPPRQPEPVPVLAEIPADGCRVLSVTPEGEGETVAVVLAVSPGEGEKPRRVRLHLLTEQYAELGVQVGEISPERADTLLEAGKLCAAIRRGMGLLAYGDQSAHRLAYKLAAKGMDRDVAEAAAAYLAEKGYIREEDTATLRARRGVQKGWGLIRIREDLRAHGFGTEAAEGVVESLSDVDFTENCAEVIRKKYGGVPPDRQERQKMMAALMRLGYGTEEIREAMRRILREG